MNTVYGVFTVPKAKPLGFYLVDDGDNLPTSKYFPKDSRWRVIIAKTSEKFLTKFLSFCECHNVFLSYAVICTLNPSMLSTYNNNMEHTIDEERMLDMIIYDEWKAAVLAALRKETYEQSTEN